MRSFGIPRRALTRRAVISCRSQCPWKASGPFGALPHVGGPAQTVRAVMMSGARRTLRSRKIPDATCRPVFARLRQLAKSCQFQSQQQLYSRTEQLSVLCPSDRGLSTILGRAHLASANPTDREWWRDDVRGTDSSRTKSTVHWA